MFSDFGELTLTGSWQTLNSAGLKEFFIYAEFEAPITNGAVVEIRRKDGGTVRELNPGDIDRVKMSQNILNEPVKDSGISVKGTAGDKVLFEQGLFDYQGA